MTCVRVQTQCSSTRTTATTFSVQLLNDTAIIIFRADSAATQIIRCEFKIIDVYRYPQYARATDRLVQQQQCGSGRDRIASARESFIQYLYI